eukprot:5770564-Prorocentrum_lima.AAC.1
MTSSLVGSEMCIRDRQMRPRTEPVPTDAKPRKRPLACEARGAAAQAKACLLYTSDAADDM